MNDFMCYPIHAFHDPCVHSFRSLQPTLPWKFSYPVLQGQEKEPWLLEQVVFWPQ